MEYDKSNFYLAAKDLALGSKTYVPHLGCTDKNKLLVSNNSDCYSGFCMKCSEKFYKPKRDLPLSERQIIARQVAKTAILHVSLPSDYTLELPPSALRWFAKYGMRYDLPRVYSIGYSEFMDRVVIPIYKDGSLVSIQSRLVSPRKGEAKYLNSKDTGGNVLFYGRFVSKGKPIILTEDVLSAMKVQEALPLYSVISILGTNLSNKKVLDILKLDAPMVFIWLDGDEAGKSGARKAMTALAQVGLKVRNIKTELDPKEYNSYDIQRIVA